MSEFILNDHYVDPESGRTSAYFCRLFILIGQESLQYCLLDTDKNMFINLADYRLQTFPKSPEVFYSQLEKLISGEEVLLRKYPSVVIGLDSSWHTLVPSPFFDTGLVKKYLEFNFNLPDNCQIRSDKVTEIDSLNVYGFLPGLFNVIQKYFGEAAVIHRSSALITAIYLHHMADTLQSCGFLNIRSQFIDLVFFEENRPVFINSFPIASKEDILYFTLYAVEQLKLRPDSLHLFVSGMVESGSDSILLLGQFVRTISFTPRLAAFSYSPALNQVPSHFYQELFALALCGS